MKVGLANPCSLKKGFHSVGSEGLRCGIESQGPSFGTTDEVGGPTAGIVLRVAKFGGPGGGVKDDGKDAAAVGRAGTGGGSVNTFLGIDPSTFAGTTPGC